MLRDEVAVGTEVKREEHLNNILAKYQKMSVEERQKCQNKLQQKYRLNKAET